MIQKESRDEIRRIIKHAFSKELAACRRMQLKKEDIEGLKVSIVRFYPDDAKDFLPSIMLDILDDPFFRTNDNDLFMNILNGYAGLAKDLPSVPAEALDEIAPGLSAVMSQIDGMFGDDYDYGKAHRELWSTVSPAQAAAVHKWLCHIQEHSDAARYQSVVEDLQNAIRYWSDRSQVAGQ